MAPAAVGGDEQSRVPPSGCDGEGGGGADGRRRHDEELAMEPPL